MSLIREDITMNKYGMIVEEKRVHFVIVEAEDEDRAFEIAAEMGVDDYDQTDIGGDWDVTTCQKFKISESDKVIAKKVLG